MAEFDSSVNLSEQNDGRAFPARTDDGRPPLLEPVDTGAIDRMVLQYAVLNGAFDLLPAGIAVVAIIPVQMRMVYRIGKQYGYTLDRGHIRDFLVAAGVGLAAQAAGQFGRRVLGGLTGAYSGTTGALAAGAMTGAATSFAATYALGRLATRYYANGRRMKTAVLRETYRNLHADGRRLFGLHAEDVQARARTLHSGDVIDLVCRRQ